MNFFKSDLEYSNSDRVFWNKFYQKAFPNMTDSRLERSLSRQKMGIDIEIYLNNGTSVFVEEKTRKKSYNDILLEYISNDKTGSLGWMEKDLKCDYLAYAVMSKKKVYLFSWTQLQKVWFKNRDTWIDKFPRIVAQNPKYKTISVGVPVSIIKKYVNMETYNIA